MASYFLIYKKPEYKSLTKDIEVLAKKVEQKREEGNGVDKTGKKKSQQMEERLK